MTELPAWVWPLISAAASWGGAWGAIRTDLRALRERIARAEATADSAHQRLDTVLARQSSPR